MNKAIPLALALGLLLGGAVGNLVDRVRYGEVVDFLHAHPDHEVRIDVSNSTLTVAGLGTFEFPLDRFSAYCLIRGIDPLTFLLENESEISRHEQQIGGS